MKRTGKILFIAFLLYIYIYICKINSIPNSIILYDKENLNLGKFWGISYKIGKQDLDSVLASNNLVAESKKENVVSVKLFDTITLKEVSVNIIDKTKVIPVGQVAGLKLYTNGVLVVGMGEIKGINNEKYKPYENSGIKEGDRIIKINQDDVIDTNNLIELVNKSLGETIQVEYIRDNKLDKCNIKPIKYIDGTYKIGLWVRDSSAGIGTLTFYEPETGKFAALGHGISDIDTGDLIEISNGEFLTTKIISIAKGIKGRPRKNSRYYRELFNHRQYLQK